MASRIKKREVVSLSYALTNLRHYYLLFLLEVLNQLESIVSISGSV